jgi:hypothetical protein
MAKKEPDQFAGNEWSGWMIFHHKDGMIGLVQSSFSLNKGAVESTLNARSRHGERIHRVRLTIEDE